MRTRWVICLLMCVCLSAGADDLWDDEYTGDGGTVAFYHGIGGTVQLMNGHSNVCLVQERVDIKIGPENAWVRCNCELHNEGGMTNAVLGFPELGPKDSEVRNGSYFMFFKSWIDGKRVDVPIADGSKYASTASGVWRHGIWRVKNVQFNAGQTRTVAYEYSSSVGDDAYGFRVFVYGLAAGKKSTGRVDRAIISVDAADLLKFCSISETSPKKCVRSRSTLRWTFTNFEPSEDIRINYRLIPAVLNGRTIDMNNASIQDGILMVEPGAFVGTPGLRLTMNTDGSKRTVIYGAHKLAMSLNVKTAILDGKVVHPRIAPNDRMMTNFGIPIVSVIRALGGTAVYSKSGALVLSLPRLNAPKSKGDANPLHFTL